MVFPKKTKPILTLKSAIQSFLEHLLEEGKKSLDPASFELLDFTYELYESGNASRIVLDHLESYRVAQRYNDLISLEPIVFWRNFNSIAYNLIKVSLTCDTRAPNVLKQKQLVKPYESRGKITEVVHLLLNEILIKWDRKHGNFSTGRDVPPANDEDWMEHLLRKNYFERILHIFKDYTGAERTLKDIRHFFDIAEQVSADIRFISNLLGPEKLDLFARNFFKDLEVNNDENFKEVLLPIGSHVNDYISLILKSFAKHILNPMKNIHSDLAILFDECLSSKLDLESLMPDLFKALIVLKYGTVSVIFYKLYAKSLERRRSSIGGISRDAEKFVLIYIRNNLSSKQSDSESEAKHECIRDCFKLLDHEPHSTWWSRGADEDRQQSNFMASAKNCSGSGKISTNSGTIEKSSSSSEQTPSVKSPKESPSTAGSNPAKNDLDTEFENEKIESLKQWMGSFFSIEHLFRKEGSMSRKEVFAKTDKRFDEFYIDNALRYLEETGRIVSSVTPDGDGQVSIYYYVNDVDNCEV